MPCIKLENQNPLQNESQIILPKIKKLFIGINSELYKRDFYYSSSDPARYAFFAFFVAAILVFIIMTCLINRRRMKDGRAPVISSYLSPPTYNQSQNVYGVDATNLPTYTPNANANQDVGYYDKNGNFIPTQTVKINQNDNQNNNNNNNISDNLNNDIELVNNPNNNNNNNSNSINNQYQSFQQSIPSAVYTPTPNVYEPQNLNDMSYKRPNGPPPTQLYNSSNLITGSSNNNANNNDNDNNNNNNDNAALPPYEAPPLPEKGHYKN